MQIPAQKPCTTMLGTLKTLSMCNQKILKVKIRIFQNDMKHGTGEVPVSQINSSVALEQGSILL